MQCLIFLTNLAALITFTRMSDARPTGDQEVAGFILVLEVQHEIFSTIILRLPVIQEEQLSVSGERTCILVVYRL